MKLVVDASVAVKWFVGARPGEQDVAQAATLSRLLDKPETELYAPIHWGIEILAVLARVDPSLVDDALLVLHDMRPLIRNEPAVIRRAADLAVHLRHHMFDTLYHAVALEAGALLVTSDKVYYDKARSLGSVAWLATFQVPPSAP